MKLIYGIIFIVADINAADVQLPVAAAEEKLENRMTIINESDENINYKFVSPSPELLFKNSVKEEPISEEHITLPRQFGQISRVIKPNGFVTVHGLQGPEAIHVNNIRIYKPRHDLDILKKSCKTSVYKNALRQIKISDPNCTKAETKPEQGWETLELSPRTKARQERIKKEEKMKRKIEAELQLPKNMPYGLERARLTLQYPIDYTPKISELDDRINKLQRKWQPTLQEDPEFANIMLKELKDAWTLLNDDVFKKLRK